MVDPESNCTGWPSTVRVQGRPDARVARGIRGTGIGRRVVLRVEDDEDLGRQADRLEEAVEKGRDRVAHVLGRDDHRYAGIQTATPTPRRFQMSTIGISVA